LPKKRDDSRIFTDCYISYLISTTEYGIVLIRKTPVLRGGIKGHN